MAYLSACLAALWEWSIVLYAKHVAHGIIAVGIVHNGACLGIHHEILQSATLWVIGVESLRSVAILQISALLDDVFSSTHINYLTLCFLFIVYGF